MNQKNAHSNINFKAHIATTNNCTRFHLQVLRQPNHCTAHESRTITLPTWFPAPNPPLSTPPTPTPSDSITHPVYIQVLVFDFRLACKSLSDESLSTLFISYLLCSSDDSLLPKRVGAYLRKLIKAMACTGDGAEPRSVRTTFNWLSPSSTAAMEISSQLKEVFRLIDSNGDGKISPPELCELLLCMGHERATAAQEAEVMVREADCNGDGFIDLDEFMEAVGGGGSGSGGDMSGTREELMEAFRVFDVDGNGFISAEELRTVLVRLGHGKCSLRECRLMIRAVDRNGDGLVDFDEFWSMMTAGACWKVCN
ncbi:calcium-binding protein [Musa troglodytarum]|uniref:Calcium-binding protein n=2 Tax=Musa troglodytarum TaxID=320322 RepID=A0A9E7G7Z9_9LILI|nr:calcium-binding protein [Musa troglodytarum]